MFLVLFFSSYAYEHAAEAQGILDRVVSISVEKGQLKEVFYTLKNQTGARFVYSSKTIQADRKVSIKVNQKKLGEVLEELLTPFGITFKLVKDRIILYRVTNTTNVPEPVDNAFAVQLAPVVNQDVKGQITDDKGNPLPGVSVLVKGTKVGTNTDMNGAFSEGVAAYLEKKDASSSTLGRALTVATSSAGLNLSVGALVGHAKEVLGVLQSSEHRDQSRIISAPSIIATDSIPAVMNVGQDVPVLTSQAIAGGVQSAGNSVFTNTVSNRSSGVTLSLTARVNSSGVVTMMINQDVSSPQAPSAGGIQSPSFSRRSFATQLTVQDGDTVAIGGFISEQSGHASDGVPQLHRIPVLGGVFGAKAYNHGRTELIIFLTPKVLYDASQVVEATDEIRSNLTKLQKMLKDQQ